jgi:hypothetical protein
MARTLYRIFLYFVVTVMLGFAAFSLGSLLSTLLRLTALRGGAGAPTGSELVQNTVLAAIGLAFFLAVGGLFYWLIRRDIAQDPGAARGGVRSLFLNLAQAVAAIIALFAGVSAFEQIGQPFYSPDLSTPLAVTLVAVAVLALEQFERSRSTPGHGAPIALQRVHLYGVQVVVLLWSISLWSNAIYASIRVLFANWGLIADPCYTTLAERPPAPFECSLASELPGRWLAVVWAVAIWALYIWLVRADTQSVLRKVAQFLGFIVGLISTIVGVEQAAELAWRSAFGLESNVPAALATNYDFFQALVFGVVVLAVYGIWLLKEAPASPLGEQGTKLTAMALSAIVLGVPFYVAIVQLMHGLVESAVAGTALSHERLAASLGLLIAGLAHPVVAFALRQRTTPEAPVGPRRGFVLAGLAVGAVAGAIGAAISLYLLITALLGSPVGANWPVNARLGAEVLLVGGYVAGMHLWRMLAEQKLIPHRIPGVSPAPSVPVASGAIEAALDDLLAGRMTRDQAAARLRELLQREGR